MNPPAKPLRFIDTAREDLRAFPHEARGEAGYQLDKVQRALEPTDSKPFPSVGSGAYELRIATADGAFRVMYVAKFADAVYVLHAFQKKSQRTSQSDIELAARRYKTLLKELKR